MNIESCTFNIVRKNDGFEAYCETAKQIINGHAATGHGSTPLEAAEDAYKRLVASIEEQKELDAVAEIDAIWDDLLESPESLAFLDKEIAQLKADEEAGNLIPGGFDGIGEFSETLETIIKKLIALVREGMTEREQLSIAHHIEEALAGISIDRYIAEHPDENEEQHHDNTKHSSN